MTITIGGMSEEKYLAAFKKADIKVSDWARDLMGKIKYRKKKETIEVETVSVKDLGFDTSTDRNRIYEKAQEKGYGILPAEVALAYRLAYTDQPMSEWILAAMEPIADSDGDLSVFNVARDEDGQWLNTNYVDPDDWWDP